MTQSKSEKDIPILIKKYENRRLYSSTAGKHLTMDEVARLVRSGKTIHVTDAATGAEITSEILTQILLEQGRARELPAEFLLQMIRLQEDLVEGFVARFVGGGFSLLLQAQEAASRAALAFPFWVGKSRREHELEEEIRKLKERLATFEKQSKYSSGAEGTRRKSRREI